MVLIVDSDHLGTPETAWLASGRLQMLPTLNLPDFGRALVISPHPDDEVLGAGGLVSRLLDASVDVEVLAVTEGEASHPGSTVAADIDLASLRSREVLDALRQLGWERPVITRLMVPDGRVAEHEGVVADAIRDRLGPGDLCIAPWSRDGHGDHDAAGRAAAEVSSEVDATLLGYLVWAWHWADPTTGDLPWTQLARADLTSDESARKHRAVRAFRSQIHPLGRDPEDAAVLPPSVLRRFLRDFEVFVGPRSQL